MMLRAPAFHCCLPCSPSNEPLATCSGEEEEEVVDVPHELTNVPYRSEPAPTTATPTTTHDPSDQQTEAEPIDTSAKQQENKHDSTATASAQAQRHSAPPDLQDRSSQAQRSSSSSQRRGLDPDDPQKAAARLSYWGPPPYPPPTRQLPAAPVRDPARVLAESREQLRQRQQQRLLELHQQRHDDSGGFHQACRRY